MILSRSCLCLLLCFLLGCCPSSLEYRKFYAHLHQKKVVYPPMEESEYFLIVLVNARHLDYTDTVSFFKTVAKHPRDGSQNGDLGHAWIYLKGKGWVIEGGHSGERGELQARYFDGIMDLNDAGDANPARYLWQTLQDGYFEKGSGGHIPTFAAKIDLSEEQFKKILAYIRSYPFQEYGFTGCQCSTFAANVAAVAGWTLPCMASMHIPPRVYYGHQWIRLWTDPEYACITFATPDVIEKSLMEAVKEGRAENAIKWYISKRRL